MCGSREVKSSLYLSWKGNLVLFSAVPIRYLTLCAPKTTPLLIALTGTGMIWCTQVTARIGKHISPSVTFIKLLSILSLPFANWKIEAEGQRLRWTRSPRVRNLYSPYIIQIQGIRLRNTLIYHHYDRVSSMTSREERKIRPICSCQAWFFSASFLFSDFSFLRRILDKSSFRGSPTVSNTWCNEKALQIPEAWMFSLKPLSSPSGKARVFCCDRGTGKGVIWGYKNRKDRSYNKPLDPLFLSRQPCTGELCTLRSLRFGEAIHDSYWHPEW